MTKRRSFGQNRIITVSNEIDDYTEPNARQVFPVQPMRTYRQVEYSRLRQPITLPRWSRTAQAYRGMYEAAATTVPQVAPEIRVLPVDDLVYYEQGDVEADVADVDPDSQVDVCAVEETTAVEARPSASPPARAVARDDSPPAKRLRSHTAAATKSEALSQGQVSVIGVEAASDENDAVLETSEPRSERYRILRRPGSETLASRARREARTYTNDDVMAEFNGVMVDENGDQVQEEVEIGDQDDAYRNYAYTAPMTISRRATFADPRQVVNLKHLYDEMAEHAPNMMVDNFNELFTTESSMSHSLNVKVLMEQVKKSTAESNAKTICALAMQMNYMKREINRLREDLVDTRSATIQRQNYGITGRTFDLNAAVSQQWYIPEDAPLRAVDLVKTARDVSLRIGRKNMKTRDVITRFVRAVFDQLIPTDRVREYTVRDRPSTRGQSRDIGGRAKDQITGIVLDLMKLYDGEQLSGHGRLDRCSFSDFVNQAMKTVMYDMRRISPKSRKPARIDDEHEHDTEAALDDDELDDDLKA